MGPGHAAAVRLGVLPASAAGSGGRRSRPAPGAVGRGGQRGAVSGCRVPPRQRAPVRRTRRARSRAPSPCRRRAGRVLPQRLRHP
ncbi:hypothetical protein CXR04_25385 [Streptomyces sp. CMB-StM0423]|nr:hypothetical protein CXR04_25385 [Streptomyces sp. CMB-StM0423]